MSENKKQSTSEKDILNVKEDINVLEDQAHKLAELINQEVVFKEWDDVRSRVNISVQPPTKESISRVEVKQNIELEKVKKIEAIEESKERDLEKIKEKESLLRKKEAEKQSKIVKQPTEEDIKSEMYSEKIKELSKITSINEKSNDSDLIELHVNEKIDFSANAVDSEKVEQPKREFQPKPVAEQPKREFQPKPVAEQPKREFQPKPVAEQPKREFQPKPVAEQPKREFQPKPVAEQPKREFQPKPVAEQPKREFQPRTPSVEPRKVEGNDSEKTFVKKDFKKGNFKKNGPKGNLKNNQKQSFTGYNEKVVRIKRISKTTKGGRNMRFSALVIIGDKNGMVGYGTGKSIEVPIAIRKALKDAKNNLVKVKMNKNGSLFHEVIGKKGAGKVLLKPAPEGTGIIAGGPIRVLLEMAGYKDAYSKNLGKNTSLNMVLATLNGLQIQKTPREVAALRDKDIKNL